MKKETLEEFIKEELEDVFFTNISERKKAERLIELGAKWQMERSYSEEDFAIGFAEWYLKKSEKYDSYLKLKNDTKELLEIYKNESNIRI